jgi:predicted nucleic acid-binding protein
VSVKRVVVDTNVVVSALTSGGTPQKIIQAWINREFLALISENCGLKLIPYSAAPNLLRSIKGRES